MGSRAIMALALVAAMAGCALPEMGKLTKVEDGFTYEPTPGLDAVITAETRNEQGVPVVTLNVTNHADRALNETMFEVHAFGPGHASVGADTLFAGPLALNESKSFDLKMASCSNVRENLTYEVRAHGNA